MQTDPMAYLSEMGIDQYQLMHAQRLSGYQAAPIRLPSDCRLLLVSPALPHGSQAEFLQRVLKSMQLTLEQVRHIYPQQLAQLEHSAEWVWFAGCPSSQQAGKVLTSPLLSDIDGNNEQRKALWQQICSYS
ncbi:DNA polymerase III psi subunit [Vibrio ponticus]|uniref:DNA polymerase III subunit psi n=1 Tax=Vibrio rhodolitus TaxID=2231649 RepID=UPI000503D2E8|nr:DNA polymerase III subunit psi [Vibrio rhodolitus]GAK85149.1 DNA polymerase III psi subunit [Vibrio ponticus]